MSRDNSPVGYTCPLINTVISFIENIDCEDISSHEIKQMINTLEEIRSANDKLREWGNDMYYKADGLECEVDELNEENAELKIAINDLTKELEEVQSSELELNHT